MKAQHHQGDSMHEMIFENRNKEYGAYVIRNSYNETVVKSLVITITFFLTIVLGTVIYNKLTEKPNIVIHEIPTCGPNIVPQKVVEINILQKLSAAPKARLTDAPPLIIDNPTVEPPRNDNPTTNTSTLVGNGGTGTDTSATAVNNGPEVISTITVRNTDPIMIAEEMPIFKGGMDKLPPYLGTNISYPEKARVLGTEGTVFIQFVVDEEGNVGNVKVLKGVGDGCDEEAVRVVNKMPKWKPGKNAGQPVKVLFNVPIRFRLN